MVNSHVHSYHSGDSDTPMEEMILAGIDRGLKAITFTEHNDFDFPVSEDTPKDFFTLNVDSYLYELLKLRDKYADRIKIMFGLELGLQKSCFRENAVLAKSYEFDFILGSLHVVDGYDPYYPAFFENRSDREAYELYFRQLAENVRKFSNFDSLAHMDYIVRYGKERDLNYRVSDYLDYVDEILDILVDRGTALEVNTGGIRHGLKAPNPCGDILKRYREKGGELVTIGSDAHNTDGIKNDFFDQAVSILSESGFRYYALYEKRVPTMIKIN